MTTSTAARTGARLEPGALSFFAVFTFAAPVLLLASTVAYATVGGGINDGVLGGTIGIWSVIAVGVAFVGAARLLESSMPRLSRLVAFFAIAVTAGGSAFNISAIYLEANGVDFMEDAFAEHPIGFFAFLPWGWLMPVTCVLIGVLLWRARLVQWWGGVLFIVGGILFVVGRPERIVAIAILTDVILLAAFVVLGLRMLRRPVVGTTATEAAAR